MGTTAVPAPSSEPQGLSETQRIVNVFIAPTSTFTDLRRRSSWWAPWLLMSVLALISVFAMANRVGFDRITDVQMKMNPKNVERMEKLPPEQRAKQLEFGVFITKIFSYGVPVTILIACIIIAAVLMGSMNFGAGAEVPFGTALAVVFYAYLPSIIKTILIIVALFAGMDPEGFNIQNPIATNPGFFVSPLDHPALYKLASSIDVFSIWVVILMGIGFSCVSKVKRSTSIAIVAGWYILITLIGVALAAAF